uniref:Putative conserved secreted protein n=1 Tax=Lutzomyia longipalpis TaxID=7200 RepID=A0A1B0CPW6_LUTLO
MAVSKITIIFVISMVALVSAGGFGKEHVHIKIHVPYQTHDHHHHHVEKVAVPVVKHVPVYKTVHVPVHVPVHVHHEPKHEEVHVEEHHLETSHGEGLSSYASGSDGWQGSHGLASHGWDK